MEESTIINMVKSYISQSMQNLDKENNKFDFKRQWYDLKSPNGISEFLKDTTAIANTFGLHGYIVIGFDDKAKEYFNSKFSNSGLKDKILLADLIIKHVDRLFTMDELDITIDGHSLSVIHIPPSIDKPHVIRSYKTFDKQEKEKIEVQRIFVRNASGTKIASKYDIDLMYYDRKNIIPEFKLLISCNLKIQYCFQFINNNGILSLNMRPTIENIGSRPVAISKMKFKIARHHGDEEYEKICLVSNELWLTNEIIIPSGDIFNGMITFSLEGNSFLTAPPEVDNILNSSRENLLFSPIEIYISNGEMITTELLKLGRGY